MSEMIKRVARAICAAEGHDPDGPTCDVYMPHDPDGIYPWAGYRKQARAAIESMREPGLAIRKITTFEFAEVEWPKLIDAALTSPPTEREER